SLGRHAASDGETRDVNQRKAARVFSPIVKPGGFKRFCRRCAIGLGVVLAILALFLLEEHIRGRIELNAWMKEMRARGEKFTIAELTPPPTPAEKNGAGLLMGAGFMAGRVVPDNLPYAMRF